MASLARLFSVSKSLGSQFAKSSVRNKKLYENLSIRTISTSKKDRDDVLDEPLQAPPSHIMKQPITPIKDWQSYGFDEEDQVKDLNEYHEAMFLAFSLIFVAIPFYWSYFPDYLEIDWTQREAYLLLREREAAGLPYVNPNYVDPATINLPSDEELEDFEIII